MQLCSGKYAKKGNLTQKTTWRKNAKSSEKKNCSRSIAVWVMRRQRGWDNKLNLLLIFWRGSHKFTFSHFCNAVHLSLYIIRIAEKAALQKKKRIVTKSNKVKKSGAQTLTHKQTHFHTYICRKSEMEFSVKNHLSKRHCFESEAIKTLICEFFATCWTSHAEMLKCAT